MPEQITTKQIIFKSSVGVERGEIVRWINKLWLVRLPNRSTCYVMPCQILAPEQAAVMETMERIAPGTGYEWVSSRGQ